MDTKTIMLMGRSGSGKGSQAKLLKEYLEKTTGLGVIYISTGDKMREVMALKGNETARLIDEKIMKNGNLAPHALPIWAWLDVLIHQDLHNGKHLILDGTPRMAPEAEILIGVLKFYEREHITPIALDIPRDEAERRLLARGRADDVVENIKNRLDSYEAHAIPTIVVLNKIYKVHNIFATGDKSAIHEKIIKIINA
jgi:adenylate kinase family enzyme